MNTRLVVFGLFVGFIVYMFVLASIITGFPPDTSFVKIPSEYTRLLGAGGIVFALIVIPLVIVDAKDKIFTRLRWRIAWLTSVILSVTSFILYFLVYDIMGNIGYGNLFFLIGWISVFVGSLFYRKIDNENLHENKILTKKEIG